ncbi:phosphatase PAP2 family protein [uncultured Faecalibaculum sp.]|uniref:phosphatase PAP2 family protein n=1 Tax=uncultured Faecalibaculum sp. TaxID=1729681 RepID=UPI00260AA09D|nr:phosphatase PAP2 family protein [uncultured Faecalibaculum sp.]
MKQNTITKFLAAAVVLLLFVLFTVCLTGVDLRPVGPESSYVGFASLNDWVFKHLGTSGLWDKITDIIALAAIALAAVFGATGIWQWMKGKSLKAVDPCLIVLGIFYIMMAAFYLAFEFIVINYRPVLVDGALEASYPSSHTFVTLFIFFSALPVTNRLVKNQSRRMWINVTLILLSIIMVVGRVLSGMHWTSDVVGAFLLALGMALLYDAFVLWWRVE